MYAIFLRFTCVLIHSILQSAIKASSGKPKKDKKKAKKASPATPLSGAQSDQEDDVSKGPVQMTAEELADEEWGPAKEKGKKGKKGKGKKGKKDESEDEEEEKKDEEPKPGAYVVTNLSPLNPLKFSQ